MFFVKRGRLFEGAFIRGGTNSKHYGSLLFLILSVKEVRFKVKFSEPEKKNCLKHAVKI